MAAPEPSGAFPSAADVPPRKWKQIALAFAVVYPLVTLLNTVIAPQIAFIGQPRRSILIVLCMATVLIYVLPWANKRAAKWLSK
jgi:antibiotic biosynthesis monooxygenase (ABM) superfamily enzyme